MESKEKLQRVSFLTPYQVIHFLKMSIYNTVAALRYQGRDRFFRQCQGLAMGKAYSPVVADLFMGFWEEDLKQLAAASNVHVIAACRYMDDYLLLCQGVASGIENWISALNRKDTNIRVSHEMEKDGQIPFLDIWIRRHSTGFETAVYRKACNTDQVVPFHSYTDSRYLRSAITSDVIRAWRYCKTPHSRKSELAFIYRKFLAGGYPSVMIQSTVEDTIRRIVHKARALTAPPDFQPRTPITVSFPFFGKHFYVLRRLAARVGIRVVARPTNTVCSRQKYRLPRLQESGVVYSIQCECGHLYVGETGRELDHRVREHRLSPSSAFRLHPSCNPNYNDVQVLCREPHPRLRLLLESAMIRVLGASRTIMDSPNDQKLNRNAGTLLDDLWSSILTSHS